MFCLVVMFVYGIKTQDNIAKYESVHGTIKEVKGSGPAMPLSFDGPTALA